VLRMENSILFSHRVTNEEDGLMVKQVIQRHFPFSRRLLRMCVKEGLITVNGEQRYLTSRVHSGERIELHVVDQANSAIRPEPIEFTVLYEDQDLIVIDKPPGLVVHPTKGYPSGTLVNGLAYYFMQNQDQSSIHPVHRLDKDTSGLMVIAKHPFAHSFLAREFAKKRYQRIYYAIVAGVIQEEQGVIAAPIGMDPNSQIKRRIETGRAGKPAITHFSVYERLQGATFVKLQLQTGRTHQIRVHMASIGHPLIGDHLYGDPNDPFPRQALHAAKVKLLHPRKKKWVQWESFFPRDIMKLYAELRMIK